MGGHNLLPQLYIGDRPSLGTTRTNYDNQFKFMLEYTTLCIPGKPISKSTGSQTPDKLDSPTHCETDMHFIAVKKCKFDQLET